MNDLIHVHLLDNEDPVLTGCQMEDILANTTVNAGVAEVTWTPPTAMDNSGPVTANLTSGLPPGSNFTAGSTLITYTVTDPSSNSVSCSFFVNVSGKLEHLAVDFALGHFMT